MDETGPVLNQAARVSSCSSWPTSFRWQSEPPIMGQDDAQSFQGSARFPTVPVIFLTMAFLANWPLSEKYVTAKSWICPRQNMTNKKEKDTCSTSTMLKWLLKMIVHPFRQRHLHLLFFDFVLVASVSVLRGQKIWRIILMQHVNICDSR